MEEILARTSILTKHPTRNVFYCFLNNYGTAFIRKNEGWIKNNFEYDEKEMYIMTYAIDYRKPRTTPLEKRTLPGITLDWYQDEAVELMLANRRYCFFFGPGTGKTIMAMSYILSEYENDHTANFVVITPKSVIKQYQGEIEKYLPSEANIIVTNYEGMKKIPKGKITGLIFDESHRLKSFTSNLNKEATELATQAESVFMFTGTPQDANRDEVMAQIKVMCPYLAPFKTVFMERYFYLDDYYKPKFEKRPKELDEILLNLTFGDETDNLIQLPPEEHLLVETRFKDKTLYNKFDKDHIATVKGHVITADNRAVAISKLKQISSGFIITNNEEVIELDENPRREVLTDLLLEVDKALIFTNFKYDQDVVQEVMKELGKKASYLNGSNTKKQSDQAVDDFKNGKVDYLVAQSKSGSTGLDLPVVTKVVYYSLPESFIVYDQSKYRIRRRGQKNICSYYTIIVKGTEDRKMVRRLKEKYSKHKTSFKLYRRSK